LQHVMGTSKQAMNMPIAIDMGNYNTNKPIRNRNKQIEYQQ